MVESTSQRLREDARRLRRYLRSKYGYAPITWFLEPAWLCVFTHRLSHRAWRKGHGKAARFWMQLNSLLTGADIQPASDLGAGLLIPSPMGVTLSAKAGANLTVLALAGLGGNIPTKDVGAGPGLPLLGRDVHVGQFTGIQGAILIGDAALFYAGAGAIVNVPAGARMVPQVEPEPGPPLPDAVPHPPIAACGHGSWRETSAHFRQDVERVIREMTRLAPPGQPPPRPLSVILTNPLAALWTYRVSHWLHCNGWRRLAGLFGAFNLVVHKITIPPQACLGGGVLMPHLAGLVVHGRAGANLAIFANAVCSCRGDAASTPAELAPHLGDDVMIGGHSGAFGAITLGNRVQVGPKTQVTHDIASDMQVFDPHSRGTTDAPAIPARDLSPSPVSSSRPWGEAWRAFRRDRERWREQATAPYSAAVFPGLVCVALFRLSHTFHRTGWLRLARWCCVANIHLTGADITPASEIDGGLLMPHPAGVALHGRAGRDLTVMAASGFGALLHPGDTLAPLSATPRIADRVRLEHHSGVFGPVEVGDDASVPPGGVINRSIPAGATLLPRPLRVRDRRRIELARERVRASRGLDAP